MTDAPDHRACNVNVVSENRRNFTDVFRDGWVSSGRRATSIRNGGVSWRCMFEFSAVPTAIPTHALIIK